ncbi:hypothetical protein H2200_009615 [Cladophialophora chaetospira]|uniref:Indoleamine 2,3-dioxygenase n=1 Tax=Cladophialophora chaetospira TaxID=386627 RepID=A0AA39CEY0_9EURO|nr:hypothetical protein H2200_009615 [Cladophialophora chaetospira]
MTYLTDSPPLPPLSALFPDVRSDATSLPRSTDPFTVTTATGFLPCRTPLLRLPAQFDALSAILDDMPIVKADGSPGLLATFKLGPLIDSGALLDLTSYIEDLKTENGNVDLDAITAIFRDYSFLASAYLLEPCWESRSKAPDAGMGLGRAVLPACIASPLVNAADILDIPPFMSYAASYALYNYSLVNPNLGASVYENLRLIRAFEQGLNAVSSEAGFILTHIHMVQETGPLISGALDLLSTIEDSSKDFSAAIEAFRTMLSAMQRIEAHMELMWSHSAPKDYTTYRTFIFGITSQSMFPNGVIYQGTRYGDSKPLYFRGESGANDSIIPLLDHLLEIPMLKNPLTEILVDFRSYRPKPHRDFLAWVMSKSAEVGVKDYCTHPLSAHGSEENALLLSTLYLKLLDHVRSFRWRHWLFAREYIIKWTSHPTATGGSPIVTWLPNQLLAVMDLMREVFVDSGLAKAVEQDVKQEFKVVKEIMDNVVIQQDKLDKEVRKYCCERGVQ